MVLSEGLFPTDKGMSMASSLSPILGNMMLDGLQTYIYNHLYPSGGVDNVWGYSCTRDMRNVDVTVRRLREKIEDDSANPTIIVTRRGIGYMFSAGY